MKLILLIIIIPLLPWSCLAGKASDNMKAFNAARVRAQFAKLSKPTRPPVKPPAVTVKKDKTINMPLSYTPELMTTMSVVNDKHTYSVILRHQILNTTFNMLTDYFGKNSLFQSALQFNPVVAVGIRSFLKDKPYIYFDFMQSINIAKSYSVGVKLVIENPFKESRHYISSYLSYTKVLTKKLVSLYIAYSSPVLHINTKDLSKMFSIAKQELFKSSNVVLGLFFEKDITALNPIGLSLETNLTDNVALSIHYKI